MSCVEIYKINKKDKTLSFVGDANNAWLGCMHIWTSLEKKYLPSLEEYPWEKYTGRTERDYRTRTCLMTNRESMQEIWNLWCDERLSWNEHILMASTLDNFYIKYEDLLEVADAYESVDFANDNLKKQAKIMRKIFEDGKDGSVFGVWKNENSVCSVYDFCDCDPIDEDVLLMPDKWESVMDVLRETKYNNWKIKDENEDS